MFASGSPPNDLAFHRAPGNSPRLPPSSCAIDTVGSQRARSLLLLQVLSVFHFPSIRPLPGPGAGEITGAPRRAPADGDRSLVPVVSIAALVPFTSGDLRATVDLGILSMAVGIWGESFSAALPRVKTMADAHRQKQVPYAPIQSAELDADNWKNRRPGPSEPFPAKKAVHRFFRLGRRMGKRLKGNPGPLLRGNEPSREERGRNPAGVAKDHCRPSLGLS